MDPSIIPLFINLGLFAFLILLGLFVGKTTEIRHLRNLDRREAETSSMRVSDIKSFPGLTQAGPQGILVTGEAVIATDYLKSFLAGLRKIIGGEVRSYETLVLRARREATLRMMEEARRLGFDAVCNVRLESADIGGNSTRKRVAMVAVLASGTAYRVSQQGEPE